MGRVIRSCIQSVLKLLNCITGMVGLAMILYAVWVIRAWQTQFDDSPFDESDYFAPWFIYTILSLGVFRASSCAQVIQLQKQQTDAAFIWINLNAVLICSFLGLSLLVAMVLKALGYRQYCDSDDDDDASHRVPLLKQPQYVFGNPVM